MNRGKYLIKGSFGQSKCQKIYNQNNVYDIPEIIGEYTMKDFAYTMTRLFVFAGVVTFVIVVVSKFI